MANTEPLFDFSLKRWPPIYRFKRPGSDQEISPAETEAEPAAPSTDSPATNLLQEQPNPIAEPEEQTPRPASSPSQTASSVPLMNPYPIVFPAPMVDLLTMPPALQPASPAPYLPVINPQSLSSSSRGHSITFQQFGVAPSNTPIPTPFPIPGVPASFWGPVNPIIPSTHPSAMGGSLGSSPPRGDFPPLYSLPPTFWEPVVRQPEPDPTPPMHTPQAPTLENLAGRQDGRGENFSDSTLKAIIIKAQPHHNDQSLSHLTRAQLVKHVDDLVAWWRRANPQQATQVQQSSTIRTQDTQQQHQQQQMQMQQVMQQMQQMQQLSILPQREEQRPRSAGVTPLTPAVQASVASAAASAKAQEKVIGQCSCCCDAQQNAAFAPCGHLYACTRCAHRLYDQGRGKCPVCRTPIQTYLKIYATA
jgi:Zinc finger, C3HC4 type (RING finger)